VKHKTLYLKQKQYRNESKTLTYLNCWRALPSAERLVWPLTLLWGVGHCRDDGDETPSHSDCFMEGSWK